MGNIDCFVDNDIVMLVRRETGKTFSLSKADLTECIIKAGINVEHDDVTRKPLLPSCRQLASNPSGRYNPHNFGIFNKVLDKMKEFDRPIYAHEIRESLGRESGDRAVTYALKSLSKSNRIHKRVMPVNEYGEVNQYSLTAYGEYIPEKKVSDIDKAHEPAMNIVKATTVSTIITPNTKSDYQETKIYDVSTRKNKAGINEMKIMAYLCICKSPVFLSDIAENIGEKVANIGTILTRLVSSGKVNRSSASVKYGTKYVYEIPSEESSVTTGAKETAPPVKTTEEPKRKEKFRDIILNYLSTIKEPQNTFPDAFDISKPMVIEPSFKKGTIHDMSSALKYQSDRNERLERIRAAAKKAQERLRYKEEDNSDEDEKEGADIDGNEFQEKVPSITAEVYLYIKKHGKSIFSEILNGTSLDADQIHDAIEKLVTQKRVEKVDSIGKTPIYDLV